MFNAVAAFPFGKIGILANEKEILTVQFVATETPLVKADNGLSKLAIEQIEQYLTDSHFSFTLPLATTGTVFQKKVWQSIANIPSGQVSQYGHIAQELQSSARAVGNACGRNPYVLIVPCHRVVGAHTIGGFVRQGNHHPYLNIKRYLLKYENARWSE